MGHSAQGQRGVRRSNGGCARRLYASARPDAPAGLPRRDLEAAGCRDAHTPGQAHDITQALPLLDQVEPEAFLGDKGYDSDALIEKLNERGIKAVIPPKANRTTQRKTDFALYRERNLVERFFNIIKNYRAISTRYYDKLASTFLAAAALVCVQSWLN